MIRTYCSHCDSAFLREVGRTAIRLCPACRPDAQAQLPFKKPSSKKSTKPKKKVT